MNLSTSSRYFSGSKNLSFDGFVLMFVYKFVFVDSAVSVSAMLVLLGAAGTRFHRILYTIPKNTILNGHHPKWTPSRMGTIPNGHNPEWTPSRMDTIPNGHNPEWTQFRMDTIPNGHHPEWTQSRMDTIPNGHNPERTLSRMSTYNCIVTLVFNSYCLVRSLLRRRGRKQKLILCMNLSDL